jgi:Arylsulfatase A and related enzymes
VLPRPDYHFSGNVGRTYLDSAKPQFPQPVQAPKGAPNIVLILIDDAGFGQFSTFGGGIPSPTMDKLAAEGCGTTASIRLPCAARLGPRSSPAATTTRRRPALSPSWRPDTTATRR